MKPTLLIVVPTYGAFDFAARAIRSATVNTRTCEPYFIVVDDATPVSARDHWHDLYGAMNELRSGKAWYHSFSENGGLTRSWNYGIEGAINFGCDYCCVTNSDVVFTPGWDGPIVEGLKSGMALLGPSTNAPGTEEYQCADRWLPSGYPFVVNDDQSNLDGIAKALFEQNGNTIVRGPINGFCMIAETGTWDAHRYAKHEVFRPRNELNSFGKKNFTPLMTLQEYELQKRWHKAGLQTGLCPGSFVFHYRAVSRGRRYLRGKWFRTGRS